MDDRRYEKRAEDPAQERFPLPHPPTIRNPFWHGDFADPFLLKVRGMYYAFATEPADRPEPGAPIFPILRSEDMIVWEAAGHALTALDAPFFRYWAPEVTAYNGLFYLYYAVHTDEFRAAIRVAVAEQPAGPYRDTGRDLTSSLFPWAIDPHVFRDDDGRWYLYYTVEFLELESGLTGTGNVVDLLLDPLTVVGRPARVTAPRHAWQLFEAQRAAKGGVDWYTVEGPTVLRHRNRYYEMFSGGCYYRDNYAVSYAVSDTPIGAGGLHDTSWEDRASDPAHLLIAGRAGSLVSPGHNSVVAAPNNVDLYLAYHAWLPDRSGRFPCLDRLYWHGDVPWTPAPTIGPQEAPPRPRLYERFAGQALDPAWTPRDGRWRQREGMVVQEDQQAGLAALAHCEPLGPAWLLEVNLCRQDGDAAAGVALRGEAEDGLDVLIDVRAGMLRARMPDVAGGALAATSLPEGFRSEAWHQVLLGYRGEALTVRLDGVPSLRLAHAGLTGGFSLLTERGGAAFAAVALTDHFRDEFLEPDVPPERLGWRTVGPAEAAPWRVRDGAIEQPLPNGVYTLLSDPRLARAECGATLRALQPGTGGEAAFGLLLQQTERDGVAVLFIEQGGGWRLRVEGWGRAALTDGAADLPPGIDLGAWQTLRLVRDADRLVVELNGLRLLDIAMPPGAASPGLITRGTAAAFTGVWCTGRPAISVTTEHT